MANKPKYLEFDDIRKYTGNFSPENFFSRCTYGREFRGRIADQECTVKIRDNAVLGGKRGRCDLFQELILPRWNNFKGIPKIVGSCDDENYPCAIVYDLKSMDTVHNLMPKDNFSWTNRIKVALGFALCLRSFHVNETPFVIRNLDAAHIMCDQDYTPTLYEYGFLAGGPSWFRWEFDGRSGSPGYIDPYFTDKEILDVEDQSWKIHSRRKGGLWLGVAIFADFFASIRALGDGILIIELFLHHR